MTIEESAQIRKDFKVQAYFGIADCKCTDNPKLLKFHLMSGYRVWYCYNSFSGYTRIGAKLPVYN